MTSLFIRFTTQLFSLFFYVTVVNATPLVTEQNVIDQWISVALAINASGLPQSGAAECSYLPGMGHTQKAFGQNQKLAQTTLALLCIKAECESLDSNILSGIDKVMKLSDAEFIEFLRGQGLSAEAIDNVLKNRSTYRPNTTPITCSNATPMARTFVFDSCFSIPMVCR